MSNPGLKEFSVETIDELLSKFDQSADFSTYSDALDVANEPDGFEDEDVEMAKRGTDEKTIQEHLAPSPQNQIRDYRIGAAFMRGRDGSLRLGHAAVVLRDYGLKDKQPSPFESKITVDSEGELPPEVDNLKLLHLHFSHTEENKMVLALDVVKRPVKYYRHVDLLRIRTTERLLKHIALQSCPSQHRILVQDCATFARNFFTRLLRHLKDSPVLSGLSEKELKKQINIVVQNIRIEEGSIGESEDMSRKDEVLAESAHTSIAGALKAKRTSGVSNELSAR